MQETQKQGGSARRDSGRVVVAQLRQTGYSFTSQRLESQLTSAGPTGTGLRRASPRKALLSPDAAAGMELLPECSKQQARGHKELWSDSAFP